MLIEPSLSRCREHGGTREEDGSTLAFSIGGVTHHGGQAGGCSPMRDIPRFVEMLDSGEYDAQTLATTVVPLEQMLEAYEEVAYRTTITAIMTA